MRLSERSGNSRAAMPHPRTLNGLTTVWADDGRTRTEILLSRRAVDAPSRSAGRVDQRSPAKRSFSGTAAPVGSWTRTKVSMPINSPNLSLPILRKKMFSP